MKYPVLTLPITIDDDNDLFRVDLGAWNNVNITQGTYDSIVELVDEIEIQINAVDATLHAVLNSNGTITIGGTNMQDMDAGGEDLLELLGYENLFTMINNTYTTQHPSYYSFFPSSSESDDSTIWNMQKWIHQAHNGVSYSITQHNNRTYTKDAILLAVSETEKDYYMQFFDRYAGGMRYYAERADIETDTYYEVLLNTYKEPQIKRQEPNNANYFIITIDMTRIDV